MPKDVMHFLQTVLFFTFKEQKQTTHSLKISNLFQSKWIVTHTINPNANANYTDAQFLLTP